MVVSKSFAISVQCAACAAGWGQLAAACEFHAIRDGAEQLGSGRAAFEGMSLIEALQISVLQFGETK